MPQLQLFQAASPALADTTTAESLKPNAIPPSAFGAAVAEVAPGYWLMFGLASLASAVGFGGSFGLTAKLERPYPTDIHVLPDLGERQPLRPKPPRLINASG